MSGKTFPLPEERKGGPVDPIVIAVMGTTGVGKSTFIQYATGIEVGIGDGLESYTSKTRLYQIPNTNIYLIDTPGFDDTYGKDIDILQEIAECLKDCFYNNWKVSGVLYIHAITEARMKGSARKNLVMFEKVVGANNMAQCCLVTTKWSLQPKDKFEGRELELKTNKKFWRTMMERGARVVRFGDSMQSAIDIIRPLAAGSGFTPQLTEEYAIAGKRLVQTAAGKEVNDRLEEARKAHEKEMAELRRDYEMAIRNKDAELASMIEEERANATMVLDRIKRDHERLQKTRQADVERFECELASQKSRALEKERKYNKMKKWIAGTATAAGTVALTVATGGAAPVLAAAHVAIVGVATVGHTVVGGIVAAGGATAAGQLASGLLDAVTQSL
ncbi:hypothetical protein ABW19_dt0205332 [Dactylella cylindrospora]|nr:hypothetical protein ABW19_dt0205332 [Dactylella cylindrospora]